MVPAGCILASSMALIDGSALTVALPKLRAAVAADLASVRWADAYGSARMLSIGCVLFGAVPLVARWHPLSCGSLPLVSSRGLLQLQL